MMQGCVITNSTGGLAGRGRRVPYQQESKSCYRLDSIWRSQREQIPATIQPCHPFSVVTEFMVRVCRYRPQSNPVIPSVFGRNLQCQLVRGVDTREECHWSHACSLQANMRGIQWHPRVYISVRNAHRTAALVIQHSSTPYLLDFVG
jgi:hypothetical protein